LKNAVLIYNPIAGGRNSRRERQMRQAAGILETGGIAAKLLPSTAPGSARELAQTAYREGARLILACGGDGTLNEVLNGITPGEATLGLLPGGTANVFARELGMPLDPVRAARELVRWSPRRIALGCATWPDSSAPNQSAEKRFFLSLAGVGFDAYVIHRLLHDRTRSLNVFAYVWEAVKQVFRYRFPEIICRLEGRELRGTFAVMHRTERYAGWLHLAPGASIFRDRLTLCLFESSRRSRYLRYAAAIVLRRHTRLKDVQLLHTTQISCAPLNDHARAYFELDGELAGQLPATFEVVPDALTMLLP
jgi:YegS/Rv2252/BmrU family lipid kinase